MIVFVIFFCKDSKSLTDVAISGGSTGHDSSPMSLQAVAQRGMGEGRIAPEWYTRGYLRNVRVFVAVR